MSSYECKMSNGKWLDGLTKTFQIKIQQSGRCSFVFLGKGNKSLLIIKWESFSISINGYEATSSFVVIPIRCNYHIHNHGSKSLAMTCLTCSQTTYLQCWITLEHLTLGKKLFAKTVVCRVTGKIGQRDTIMGKTKICYHLTIGAVFQYITGSKTYKII